MTIKLKLEYLPRAKSMGKTPIYIAKNNDNLNGIEMSKKLYTIQGGQTVTILTPDFDIDWKLTIKARKLGKNGLSDRNYMNLNGKGILDLIKDWYNSLVAQYLNTYYFNKWFRLLAVTSDNIFSNKKKQSYDDLNRKPFRVFIPFSLKNKLQSEQILPKYKMIFNWLKYVLNTKDENGNNIITFQPDNPLLVVYKGINRPIKLALALQKLLGIKGNDYLKNINEKYKLLLANKYKHSHEWFSQINQQGKKTLGFMDTRSGQKKTLKQMIMDLLQLKDCIIDTTSLDYKKILYSIYVNLPQLVRITLTTKTTNSINDVTNSSAPYIICISRHPYDIYSASTNRDWGSCLLIDTNNKRYMRADNSLFLTKSANISLIAYILPSYVMKKNPRQLKDKKDIVDYAIGRVMINPYVLNLQNGMTFAFRSSRFLYTNLVKPLYNNKNKKNIAINRISQNNNEYLLLLYKGLTRVFDVIDSWLDQKMKYTTPIKSGMYVIPEYIYLDNNVKMLKWNNIQLLSVMQNYIGVPLDMDLIYPLIQNLNIAKFISNIVQNQKNFMIKDISLNCVIMSSKSLNNYVMNGNKVNLGKLGYKYSIISDSISKSNISNIIQKYNYLPLSVKEIKDSEITNCFVNSSIIVKCNIIKTNLSLDEKVNEINDSVIFDSTITNTSKSTKLQINKTNCNNIYTDSSNISFTDCEIKDSNLYNISYLLKCELLNCHLLTLLNETVSILNCTFGDGSYNFTNSIINSCYFSLDSMIKGNNVKVIDSKFLVYDNKSNKIVILHIKQLMDMKSILTILQSKTLSNIYQIYDLSLVSVENKS